MTTEFKDEFKNYVFNMPCMICKEYLFLTSVKEVNKKEAKGIVYCPTCDRKYESYFYR